MKRSVGLATRYRAPNEPNAADTKPGRAERSQERRTKPRAPNEASRAGGRGCLQPGSRSDERFVVERSTSCGCAAPVASNRGHPRDLPGWPNFPGITELVFWAAHDGFRGGARKRV